MPTASELRTQIDNLIEQVDTQYIAWRDLPEGDPTRTTIMNDMKSKQHWLARWQTDYAKMTGQAYRVNWSRWRTEAEGIGGNMAAEKQRLKNEDKAAEKTRVLAERIRISKMLDELKLKADGAAQFQRENTVGMGITLSGGGGPMLLAQVNIAVSRADKLMERAREALQVGKLNPARQYLGEAAGYIEAGFNLLGCQEEAHKTGAARVELIVKVGAAVGTGFATAGAGALASVGAEALGAAVQEGGTLAATAWHGEISRQDLLDSAYNVLCGAAGSAAAGKMGGQLLGARAARLAFGKNASGPQVEAMAQIMEQYVAGNTKQVAEWVQKSAKGEAFDWKFYSAVVVPALAAKGYIITPKVIEELEAASKQQK